MTLACAAAFHHEAGPMGVPPPAARNAGERDRSARDGDIFVIAEGLVHSARYKWDFGCASRRASLMDFARLSSFSVPCRGHETRQRRMLACAGVSPAGVATVIVAH